MNHSESNMLELSKVLVEQSWFLLLARMCLARSSLVSPTYHSEPAGWLQPNLTLINRSDLSCNQSIQLAIVESSVAAVVAVMIM